MTLLWAVCAVLASGLALVPLALRDPKRLRAATRAGAAARPALSGSQRRLLALASLAPGSIVALSGQWPAFLVWLGSVTALGWALAYGFASQPR